MELLLPTSASPHQNGGIERAVALQAALAMGRESELDQGSHVIQLFIAHNNFKKMTDAVERLSHNLLAEESDAYSITLSTLFPNEMENNDEVQDLDVFESTTLDEQMGYLRRYHLGVGHLPQIKLLGDFHKNIEISMPLYASTLLQQIKKFTHQEKLDYAIHILATYRALVREYGFFLLSHDHIRVDERNSLALWINEDFKLNHPSLPLQNHQGQPQPFAVQHLIKIIRQFFTTDFFKYRKIQTFNQLASYLDFVKRRNKIHKNCRTKAREESETKRRTTLSVRNKDTPQKRHDRHLRPLCSFSTLLASNILSRGSREKYPSESLLNTSTFSRVDHSKGSTDSKKMKSEVDTTVVSSELKNTRNISYLQLSNIIQKSQKKSCVFGTNPEVVAENTIKHSSMLTRKGSSKRVNTHFCPIQYKRKAERKREEAMKKEPSLEKKNTLEIGLSNLLLSQINEDPENETGGSDLKRRQHLIDQFETLLCN